MFGHVVCCGGGDPVGGIARQLRTAAATFQHSSARTRGRLYWAPPRLLPGRSCNVTSAKKKKKARFLVDLLNQDRVGFTTSRTPCLIYIFRHGQDSNRRCLSLRKTSAQLTLMVTSGVLGSANDHSSGSLRGEIGESGRSILSQEKTLFRVLPGPGAQKTAKGNKRTLLEARGPKPNTAQRKSAAITPFTKRNHQ